MSESTRLASSSTPACATFCRRPSKWNGRVTTATVRMPFCFAMSAITGAAPVPVPPPMPAVMKSMSAPSIRSAMRSRSSIAASRPISGRAPAPSPRVSVVPSCSCDRRARALERLRVGVGADEVDAGQPAADHVLDRVAAAAAHADDLDDRAVLRFLVDDLEHVPIRPFAFLSWSVVPASVSTLSFCRPAIACPCSAHRRPACPPDPRCAAVFVPARRDVHPDRPRNWS